MTKDDIISAAFKVWGQELYKTTSLAKLAETLGVSKPALYRHFPGKEALLAAMNERFYSDYTRAIGPVLAEAQKCGSRQEGFLSVVSFITAYFARHFDYFIYSLKSVCDNEKGGVRRFPFNREEYIKRGMIPIPLDDSPQNGEQQPSLLFLAGMTGLYGTSVFHKTKRRSNGRRRGRAGRVAAAAVAETAAEAAANAGRDSSGYSSEEISRFSAYTTERVRRGLGFDRARIDAVPCRRLEELCTERPHPPSAPLLGSVARIVARAGPWKMSMKTVAEQSGLSKSSLYSHFKSKRDMLSRLFLGEFERIAGIAMAHRGQGASREEQLYAAIFSIASYLRSRPEILVALDWVRIQRLDLDISVPVNLYDFFGGLTRPAGSSGENRAPARELKGVNEDVSQWILFLLVSVLMHSLFHHNGMYPGMAAAAGEIDSFALQKLFRFITLGIEGFNV